MGRVANVEMTAPSCFDRQGVISISIYVCNTTIMFLTVPYPHWQGKPMAKRGPTARGTPHSHWQFAIPAGPGRVLLDSCHGGCCLRSSQPSVPCVAIQRGTRHDAGLRARTQKAAVLASVHIPRCLWAGGGHLSPSSLVTHSPQGHGRPTHIPPNLVVTPRASHAYA